MDSESLYRQMGRLIEAMPTFSSIRDLTAEHHLWLGRANALVRQSGDLGDKIDLGVAIEMLTHHGSAGAEMIRLVLYRVLAIAELSAPASARGAFIPAGNSFDAFASLGKILRSATQDILIVDPYMDEAPLTEFGELVPVGVKLRLLSDEANHKATLKVAVARWASQHSTVRPLEARLAPPRTLHDRAIFIDAATAWVLTQSIKDFAKRSPAEIVRADDTASLKIAAYEELWNRASVIL